MAGVRSLLALLTFYLRILALLAAKSMVIVQATEAPQDKKHRHTTGSNSATVPYGAGTSTGNSTTYMYTINSQWCVHKGIEL